MILRHTVDLTLLPATLNKNAVELLRQAELSDRTIHDITMVVACFSFMNRVADGTGVAIGKKSEDFARELLGAKALEQHRAWAAGT